MPVAERGLDRLRVSVVIPTHDRAALVGRALRSVLAQTVGDLEVIVVDDGSTDGTARVVADWPDPRVRLVRFDRCRGVAAARNEGIRQARADLVAFLDSDDEWLPEKLERQLARLEAATDPRVTTVFCLDYRYTPGWGRIPRSGVVHEGDVFASLLRDWTPHPSLALVRRSALLAVGGFDETLPYDEEQDLWLRMAEASQHVVVAAERLVIKHQHAGHQKTTDLGARLEGLEAFDRKWGPVIRQRLGGVAYRRWKATAVARAQLWGVRGAMAGGDRGRALRHCVALGHGLPWTWRFLLRGMALVLVGPRLSGLVVRLRNARLRERE